MSRPGRGCASGCERCITWMNWLAARQAIAAGEPLAVDSGRVPGRDHPGTLTSRDNLTSARRAVSGLSTDWIVPGAARDACGERVG
jgi:hypothetical protein